MQYQHPDFKRKKTERLTENATLLMSFVSKGFRYKD